MTIPQRYNLVTLGVADVAAATAFYRRLGWRQSAHSGEEISFFASPGGVVALWGIEHLAADTGATGVVAAGFRGVALAINLGSRAEVDDAVAEWVAAGGAVVTAPVAAEWGGYSGYVADLDGHLWELAHNPGWSLDDRGLAQLGEEIVP